MIRASRLRLIIGITFAVLLAGLVGAQATSSALTRSAPQQAVSFMPMNGQARERLAFAEFAAGVTEPEDAPASARQTVPTALAALRADPLVPKAHAILAMASDDPQTKSELLAAASRLNRRELALQSLVLQEAVGNSDYASTVETLDQILRVHPERSQEFFPVLNSALTNAEAVPMFADILDLSSPWHERFLSFSIGQRESLPDLALLREEISFGDESLDRRLIANLVKVSELDAAEKIYRQVTGKRDEGFPWGILDWSADYPPFQWELVDQPGFRAQTSRDEGELELSVRPGKGGPIAARLLSNPKVPFEVRIEHRIVPVERMRDVQLNIVCATDGSPIYNERFSKQGDGFRITTVPADCEHLALAINARAWSGRSALSGSIKQIELRRLSDQGVN